VSLTVFKNKSFAANNAHFLIMTPHETPESPKDQEFDWPPLESNPQVFTDYLHQIGLESTYQISEVYGFDEDLLAFLPQPTYAVIVALERHRQQDIVKGDASVQVPFYMDQSGTLDNACGIIACLHAIFNAPETTMVAADSVLDRFRQTTRHETPAERCHALETNDEFKTVHKAFALQGQSQAITSDQSKVKHHYVAFVVHDKRLLELDGTKQGPYIVSNDCSDVLRGTIAEIQQRLERGEITDQLSMMTLSPAIM
jgi:ubiquitin carboxyl-terminal hydrolase L3